MFNNNLSFQVDPEIQAYRARAEASGLKTFQIELKESNLSISCEHWLANDALFALAAQRRELEAYIEEHPEFLRSLEPVLIHPGAPVVVRNMGIASRAAGVGPMAAVAGALADAVGRRLLRKSREVIVENGGDVFCAIRRPRIVVVDAGRSEFSGAIGLRIRPEMGPLGICTSSGTIGQSLSFGRADAACVVARSAALADATATVVGNVVKTPRDIEKGLARAAAVPGVLGAVVIVGESFGARGDIELVEL